MLAQSTRAPRTATARRGGLRVSWGLGLGLALLGLSTQQSPVQAHTFMQQQQVCPLDGTRWTATLDGSGTSFGQQLDLKPVGPTPAPWRLAVCPKDHFVMYKDKFSASELAALRPFIQSPAYQAWAADHTEYFLLGKIFEHMKRPRFSIGYAFLQASWQVDRDPVRYAEYAGEALRQYEAGLAEPAAAAGDERPDGGVSPATHAELIAGELERRLGRFEAAQLRFARVQNTLPPKPDILRVIVAQQLSLIAAKDSAPHRVEPRDKSPAGPPPPPPPPPVPPVT